MIAFSTLAPMLEAEMRDPERSRNPFQGGMR